MIISNERRKSWLFRVWSQVDQLSAEVHERKKKDKDRVNSETQTEDYVWTETGAYAYHHNWKMSLNFDKI